MFSLQPCLQVLCWCLDSDHGQLPVFLVRLVVSKVHLSHEAADPGSSDGCVYRKSSLEQVSLGLLVELVPNGGGGGVGRRKVNGL